MNGAGDDELPVLDSRAHGYTVPNGDRLESEIALHRHDYTSNGVRNPHHAATQPVEQPSPHTTPPPPTAPVNSPPVSAADEITNRSYRSPRERVQKLLTCDDADNGGNESHEVFSEMEELFYNLEGEALEWKETARWVKYEENVDLGAGRWSKPHVASLSLHSLFELRKHVRNDYVDLEMDAVEFFEIADNIADELVRTHRLKSENREKFLDLLLLRHRHHRQKKTKEEKQAQTFQKQRRKSSVFPGMDRSHSSGGINGVSMEQAANNGMRRMSSTGTMHSERRESRAGILIEMQKEAKVKFLKKIPPDAEASNLLVGETDLLEKPIGIFIRLSHATIMSDLTEVPIPTRFVFLIMGPPSDDPIQYKEVGRCMATLMTDEVFRDVAYKARDREDIIAAIDEFLEQVTVLPPGSWDPSIRIEPPKQTVSQSQRRQSEHFIHPLPMLEPEDDAKFELTRTGIPFGGLWKDIKTKVPWYFSDFKDAFSIQCLAAIMFMYIACITPLVAFGGLLGAATDDNLAAFESMIGAAVCGVLFHLFAGQPLTIIGSTGPILIFETIMFQLCSSISIDYLSFRFWIGTWTCVICLILVATDASALVRYFTRFTEEAFTALIAFIFIVEAFENVLEVQHEYPLATNIDGHVFKRSLPGCMCVTDEGTIIANGTNVLPEDCEPIYNGTLTGDGCGVHEPVPDVFLLSVILFLATFGLSFALKMFRFTSFFPTRIRFLISDFGVFTAFICMTMVDFLLGIDTPKLTVPNEFRPTKEGRGWIVPFFVNPWWTYIAAIIPAMLCGILIFMDQQITAVIVNRRENKLKKGVGYHLDLLVISLLILLMSVFGMPWFVAATVLSLNHVDSLRVLSKTTIPGEPPKVEGCREQRVTGCVVFLIVGASTLLTGILRFVPMPVLYGVFLYMGVSSLRGVQFFHRILLYIIPTKHQPDYTYLRHVKLWRVHIFTLVQLICLILLWLIKTSKAAIVFPLMVLAVVFIRKLMEVFFTQYELSFLDDVIPESQKREKDDMEQKSVEKRDEEIRGRSGTLTIPLENGASLSFPADKAYFTPHESIGKGLGEAYSNNAYVEAERKSIDTGIEMKATRRHEFV
ncbi:sodium-driven chloride bicarbonate exchanger-like [Apostichopus japonicus]|uniref:sodium-driven chloride bicarbonate exchanger-like n=1 Tax=Stichopus japonicus TaxID=307972 RepID=UPI003AB3AB92